MTTVVIPSASAMSRRAREVRAARVQEGVKRSRDISLERAVCKIEEATARGNTWLHFRGVRENYPYVKAKLEPHHYVCRIEPNEREPVLHIEWTDADEQR